VKTVTNRFKQTLYRKLNDKKNQLEEKQELTQEEVLARTQLEQIEDELNQSTFLDSEEEVEMLESRIEAVNL
jgi:ATP-dependent Lon protease